MFGSQNLNCWDSPISHKQNLILSHSIFRNLKFTYMHLVFNVGEMRRKAAPESINNSEFFRPDNESALEIRE